MTYQIFEWSPEAAGDLVAECDKIEQAARVAQRLYQAQICADHWRGYVTTWTDGGASAKYFPGHDKHGFGGDVPADAARLVDLLNWEE